MQPTKPTFMMLRHVRLGFHARLPSQPHVGPNYLSFLSATGEPYTVIEFEQTLIVSGSKLHGPIRTFINASNCLLYLSRQIL